MLPASLGLIKRSTQVPTRRRRRRRYLAMDASPATVRRNETSTQSIESAAVPICRSIRIPHPRHPSTPVRCSPGGCTHCCPLAQGLLSALPSTFWNVPSPGHGGDHHAPDRHGRLRHLEYGATVAVVAALRFALPVSFMLGMSSERRRSPKARKVFEHLSGRKFAPKERGALRFRLLGGPLHGQQGHQDRARGYGEVVALAPGQVMHRHFAVRRAVRVEHVRAA